MIILLGNISASWPYSVSIIHHSGWLVVHYFAIFISFPCSLVLLELSRPAVKKFTSNHRHERAIIKDK